VEKTPFQESYTTPGIQWDWWKSRQKLKKALDWSMTSLKAQFLEGGISTQGRSSLNKIKRRPYLTRRGKKK